MIFNAVVKFGVGLQPVKGKGSRIVMLGASRLERCRLIKLLGTSSVKHVDFPLSVGPGPDRHGVSPGATENRAVRYPDGGGSTSLAERFSKKQKQKSNEVYEFHENKMGKFLGLLEKAGKVHSVICSTRI